MRVLSIGEALPGRDLPGMEVSNAMLSEALARFQVQHGLDFPLPDPQFAIERVGVHSRRFLDQQLSAYDMGLQAARQAFERAGLEPSLYRVVIFSCVTPAWVVPPQSALIQAALGLSHEVAAFDLPAGCNGYLSGLHLMRALLSQTPEGSAGLLVTSEAMSRVLDATDRQTCVIFGDAAAATVVVHDGQEGLGEVAWSTQGEKGPLIQIAPGPGPVFRFRVEDGTLELEPDPHSSLRVTMSGRQVFKDMATDLPRRIQLELDRRGRSLEDYPVVAFHQANQRIVEAVCSRLKLPLDRVLGNIQSLGNTTSASIPLLLAEASQNGRLEAGQRVLLIGFGTGYSVGLSELLWTERSLL